GNDVLLDSLFEADIGIARTLGSEVTDSCEAGQQCGFRGDGRARGSQSEGLVEDLVVPGGLVVGMEEQVGVSLDETGHERIARQVNDRGIRRSGYRWANCLDPLAPNEHNPTLMRLRVNAIEDADRLEG